MKPEPSNNNEFQALDDYFKQGADRIPVEFEQADWTQLSAMLDHVKVAPRPSAPTRRTAFWLLPALLIAVLATVGVVGAYHALVTVRSEGKTLPAVSPPVSRESTSVQSGEGAEAPPAPAESAPVNRAVKNGTTTLQQQPNEKTGRTTQPAQEMPAAPATTMPSDTAATLRTPEPAAAPSAAPAPKAKKKKNLFW